ncbi:MAG: diaminopimelate epimerase, partial [Phycisphaerae bacterium]|nr:diaminopimelate epimerase [Phycisphaerae bacterium]
MDQPIEFAKLSGSGNDFICIDNRDGRFDRLLTSSVSAHHFARTLCCRGTGIGTDGVVFAYNTEAPKTTDIAIRFFEADGAEAAFCGNGSACFTHWVVANGIVPQREVNTLTPAGIVTGRNGDDGYVRVCIPLPQDLHRDLDVPVDGADLKCDFVVVGVRHVITYVDDIEKVDVAHLGPALRHHELFQPEGA